MFTHVGEFVLYCVLDETLQLRLKASDVYLLSIIVICFMKC